MCSGMDGSERSAEVKAPPLPPHDKTSIAESSIKLPARSELPEDDQSDVEAAGEASR